jgi:sterol desaturase/sphingolipid hydroxylase (fatty acid hydroxylase superfamily)
LNAIFSGNEPVIRLGVFIGIFTVMAIWEVIAPRRPLTSGKSIRWTNNLGVTFLNTAFSRLLLPGGMVAAAMLSGQRGWGLLNNLHVSPVQAGVMSIILLDLAIYVQHVVFHRIPLLWRLHMVHHTDLDIDVTTGSRFHPIEIVISLGIKGVVLMVLGAPAWSVVAFEVLLNGTSMFNHGNARIHPTADRVLRLLVVTPDMHRVHHSVIIRETNSNFGFSLPWWDYFFGTYRAQPKEGHRDMTIGMANFRDQNRLNLAQMLALPFTARKESISGYGFWD